MNLSLFKISFWEDNELVDKIAKKESLKAKAGVES